MGTTMWSVLCLLLMWIVKTHGQNMESQLDGGVYLDSLFHATDVFKPSPLRRAMEGNTSYYLDALSTINDVQRALQPNSIAQILSMFGNSNGGQGLAGILPMILNGIRSGTLVNILKSIPKPMKDGIIDQMLQQLHINATELSPYLNGTDIHDVNIVQLADQLTETVNKMFPSLNVTSPSSGGSNTPQGQGLPSFIQSTILQLSSLKVSAACQKSLNAIGKSALDPGVDNMWGLQSRFIFIFYFLFSIPLMHRYIYIKFS